MGDWLEMSGRIWRESGRSLDQADCEIGSGEKIVVSLLL